MNTLLLTFLTMAIQLVSFTDSDASGPSVFCKFAGVAGKYSYVFNVTDVQDELKFCGAFVYGTYNFDEEPAMSTVDEGAITALVGINKIVYVNIQYNNNDYSKWSELFNPTEDGKVKIDNLVRFLSKHKISGVIMQHFALYQPETPSTAQNIADFASGLKRKMNDNLQVGMKIGGRDYLQFSNTTAFNYNVTNPVINQYFIDLTGSNYCNDTTKHLTVNPIRADNIASLTLEEQSDAVNGSAMDKSKVYAVLQVNTVLSKLYYHPQYEGDMRYGSYSELCLIKTYNDILRWCTDSTRNLFNQGDFAKNYYRGIMLSVMEGDDQHGYCNCGLFIVSKTIMSGWESSAEPTCPKINDMM